MNLYVKIVHVRLSSFGILPHDSGDKNKLKKYPEIHAAVPCNFEMDKGIHLSTPEFLENLMQAVDECEFPDPFFDPYIEYVFHLTLHCFLLQIAVPIQAFHVRCKSAYTRVAD